MSKVCGMGGWWLLPGPGSAAAIVHNAFYEVVTTEELREVRSVGCGGWFEGLPIARRVESAMFRVAEDDVSYPQVLGFTEGVELPAVWLKRGERGQYDKIEDPTVQTVHVENDQKKARWVEITLRYGRYFRDVLPPPGAP